MRYLDRPGLIAYLLEKYGVRMSLATLAARRGPKYVIINGRALTAVSDADAWVAESAASGTKSVRGRARQKSSAAA
jgi:hypothetical protein